MPLSGKGLAVTGIGALFLWSGIKGWSVLGLATDLVIGKTPTGGVANPFTLPANPNDPGYYGGNLPPELSGVGLAAIAASYEGHAYSYGGAPGLDGSGAWDCSSFTNFCTGIRMSLAIPGYGPGTYKGDVHGPPTGAWAIWPGTMSIPRSEVMAGDIIIWANHMGIALGNNEMISALNSKVGTKKTPIDGYGNGPLLRIGRYSFSGVGGVQGGGAGKVVAR